MPNAFAMGRSQKSATVCATRGILDLLSPAELEGVMAHELTHVINRDVMVMTLASFFATLASMIAQFALFFGGFGGGYGRDDEEEEGVFVVLIVSVAVYADLLPAAARALALPGVRRRPRQRGADGAAQRAFQRAVEDQRHDGARAQPGPAQGGRHERLLHPAGAHEAVADEHLRRSPAA